MAARVRHPGIVLLGALLQVGSSNFLVAALAVYGSLAPRTKMSWARDALVAIFPAPAFWCGVHARARLFH